MNKYLYQGGSKEGLPIHPKAVTIMIEILDYGMDDQRWSNYHDSVLADLSNALLYIEKISKYDK